MKFFRAQRGAALVITLIMLGMVTTMAVVFLSISRRERASVSVVTDQTGAQLMAETAAAQALSKVVGKMVATQNPLAYGFSVSTNYINRFGYQPGNLSPTNVGYVYPNGRSLSQNDLLVSLAKLQHLPRPPVFVDTNSLGWRPKNYNRVDDFRFYLDLNRNRAYEPTGRQIVTNFAGRPVVGQSGELLTDYFIGDPEWIGQLDNPSRPHGPTNRFVGRYAYMVLPTGRSLDINHIHNQARDPMKRSLDIPKGRGNQYLYMRNQGVGSWELNLAGFLAQLNPIQWWYYYDWISKPVNPNGLTLPRADRLSFSDSRDILMYRYNGARRDWSPGDNVPQGLMGMMPSLGLPLDQSSLIRSSLNKVDDYSDGPLILNDTPLFDNEDGIRMDPVIAPWPGSDNPRRFTDVQQFLTFQEYIDPPMRATNFVSRLRQSMEVHPKNNRSRKRLDSYDRYTFYRLLDQMGVDSAPALRGKLNINYANDWNTGYNTQTNWTANEFINRAAHAMLRASVSSQLLTNKVSGVAYNNYSIGESLVNPDVGIAGLQHPKFPIPQNYLFFNPTNAVSTGVQIYPTNAYSANVHRLIQLAANIHDASRANKYMPLSDLTPDNYVPDTPTVMRPVFRKFRDPNNGPPGVFISYYAQVTNDWRKYARPQRFYDLTNVITSNRFPFYDGTPSTDLDVSIHGVPWIVGAKKGLPNFNEYSVESLVQVSRRLEVNKQHVKNILPSMSSNWRTNQMYTLGITNVFGIEAWNSYLNAPNTNGYPRRLAMDVRHRYEVGLWDHSIEGSVGKNGPILITNIVSRPYRKFETLKDGWKGGEYKVPLRAALTTVTNSIYSTARKRFYPANRAFTNVFEAGFAVPDWKLHITNRVQYFLIDLEENQLIDVVNLDDMVTSMDITMQLSGQQAGSAGLFAGAGINEGTFWKTNRLNPSQGNLSPTLGVVDQIQVSSGQRQVSQGFWRSYNNDPYAGRNKDRAIRDFEDFLQGRNRPRRPSDLIRKQAPYTPARKFYKRTSWQANDPLVHYTINDLTDPLVTDARSTNNVIQIRPPSISSAEVIAKNSNLGRQNERYQPWGGSGQLASVNAFNYYLKDPLMVDSDAWKFPENKFPSIGWLGRIHRGTPWQTMYLKSGMASLTNWWSWAGSVGTHPTNDWRLLQLFTAAPNENAARGLLSVNQTNSAAWAAVFSGMPVLSNSLPDSPTLGADVAYNGTEETALIMQPSIPKEYPQHPQLDWILNGTHGLPTMWINGRSNVINGLYQQRQAMGGFRNLGDILSTPTLTEFSPFLNLGREQLAVSGVPTEQQKYAIHENVMEWLPQQMLSLVKEDEPRITVYAFGQTLKPAEQSIVTRPGQFYGMCTNYTITGEVFTKTTYRFEEQWEGTNQVYRAVVEDYQLLEEQ